MSEAGGFIVIGERINATRKSIRAAIRKRDAEFIKNEARTQAAAGAHFIDVNAGASPAQGGARVFTHAAGRIVSERWLPAAGAPAEGRSASDLPAAA